MCWLGQQVPTCPVLLPASSRLPELCCLPLLQVSIPLWALVHLPVVVTVTTAIFTPKGWLHCILYVLFENAMGIVKMGAVIAGEVHRGRRLGAGVPPFWYCGRGLSLHDRGGGPAGRCQLAASMKQCCLATFVGPQQHGSCLIHLQPCQQHTAHTCHLSAQMQPPAHSAVVQQAPAADLVTGKLGGRGGCHQCPACS